MKKPKFSVAASSTKNPKTTFSRFIRTSSQPESRVFRIKPRTSDLPVACGRRTTRAAGAGSVGRVGDDRPGSALRPELPAVDGHQRLLLRLVGELDQPAQRAAR